MERTNTEKLHKNHEFSVPHDIVEHILSRLPVKSLFRFKAVSTTWEATISDPVFARFHLQQSKSSVHKCILIGGRNVFWPDYDEFELFEIKSKQIQEVRQFCAEEIFCPDTVEDACFMCYSDGLLLLNYFKQICSFPWRKKVYALYNPSAATFVSFRWPYEIFSREKLYGFCYDPRIKDYKVVIGNEIQYAVFNCRNKCWTEMKELSVNEYEIDPQAVPYNGSLYWVLMNRYENYRYQNVEIIRFDSRDDTIKTVHKLDSIQNDDSLSLVLLGGHLCLYYNSSIQLFILKKDDDLDSWTEFITIDAVPSMNYLWPLFIPEESEIIHLDKFFNGSCKEYVVAYKWSKFTSKKIKISSLEFPSEKINIGSSYYACYIVFPFMESLMMCKRRFRIRRTFEELGEVFFLM